MVSIFRRGQSGLTVQELSRVEIENGDSDDSVHSYKPRRRKRDAFTPESRLGKDQNPNRWLMPLPDSQYLSNYIGRQPQIHKFTPKEPHNTNETTASRIRVRNAAYRQYCAQIGDAYFHKACGFASGVLPEWEQSVKGKATPNGEHDLLRPHLSKEQQYERNLAAPVDYLISKYLQAEDLQAEPFNNARRVQQAREDRLSKMKEVLERASHGLDELKHKRISYGLPKIASHQLFENNVVPTQGQVTRTPSTSSRRRSSDRSSPTIA